MAKLIFTSRYLKDAKPSQKENYVHYIGTRKGVEKIDTSKKHLPATVSQKKLVHQLLQDFPATKEMLEYEDYQRKPTIENASEFISCALEQNLDIAATRKNYVDYLAHRPRVEKIGSWTGAESSGRSQGNCVDTCDFPSARGRSPVRVRQCCSVDGIAAFQTGNAV